MPHPFAFTRFGKPSTTSLPVLLPNRPTMAYIYAMPLTPTQQKILDFLRQYIDDEGVPPTQLEICEAFSLRHNSTARNHLLALERAGVLRMDAGKTRTLRLLAPASERPATLSLPILGRVAAGAPIGADIGSDEHFPVDPAGFRIRPHYLLRVVGDSMRDEGIWDGDLVAVQRAAEARSGQIVVARIGDEITIKRLERRADALWLLPRNPDYAPLRVPADADFAVEGLYCGLVRNG